MKYSQRRESANDRPASQFEDKAANENLNEPDLQEHESSAGVYERRWRHRISINEKFRQETRWIFIAVYLLLISVALVAL